VANVQRQHNFKMSFDSEKLIQMENLVNKPKVSLIITTLTGLGGGKNGP
jgi:hypothetical protein